MSSGSLAPNERWYRSFSLQTAAHVHRFSAFSFGHRETYTAHAIMPGTSLSPSSTAYLGEPKSLNIGHVAMVRGSVLD